jgi:hypothetical protein
MKGVHKTHYTLDGEIVERDIMLDDYDRRFVMHNASSVTIDVANDVPKFYDYKSGRTISLARAILENRRKLIRKPRVTTKNGDPYDLRIENLNF